MKILFDLFPVILFFATYKLAGGGSDGNSCLASTLGDNADIMSNPILLATGVAIVATICQVAWVLARRQKVDKMLWASLAIITVFGGATLYLRDPTFIQWKPTILYWLFASVLFGAPIVAKKNLIRDAMEAGISLPETIWQRLNLSWAFFFLTMGFANLFVAKSFSCSTWVSFKLYGGMGLMLLFVLIQAVILSRYAEAHEVEKK